MSRDAVAEVLDVEGALEARGEETAEGRDEGGEDTLTRDDGPPPSTLFAILQPILCLFQLAA